MNRARLYTGGSIAGSGALGAGGYALTRDNDQEKTASLAGRYYNKVRSAVSNSNAYQKGRGYAEQVYGHANKQLHTFVDNITGRKVKELRSQADKIDELIRQGGPYNPEYAKQQESTLDMLERAIASRNTTRGVTGGMGVAGAGAGAAYGLSGKGNKGE